MLSGVPLIKQILFDSVVEVTISAVFVLGAAAWVGVTVVVNSACAAVAIKRLAKLAISIFCVLIRYLTPL